MKKLMITTAIMILFSFSSISNAEIIEMHFESGINLEFVTDMIHDSDSNFTEFGNVHLYDSNNKLHELSTYTSRDSRSIYYGAFYFGVYTMLEIPGEYYWYDDTHIEVSAIIESANIYPLGYDDSDELTPILLEEIFDKITGLPNFFKYDFDGCSNSNGTELEWFYGRTTLTSWNYKTAPVPIPPTLWLFGSGLIGLVGIHRRKKV